MQSAISYVCNGMCPYLHAFQASSPPTFGHLRWMVSNLPFSLLRYRWISFTMGFTTPWTGASRRPCTSILAPMQRCQRVPLLCQGNFGKIAWLSWLHGHESKHRLTYTYRFYSGHYWHLTLVAAESANEVWIGADLLWIKQIENSSLWGLHVWSFLQTQSAFKRLHKTSARCYTYSNHGSRAGSTLVERAWNCISILWDALRQECHHSRTCWCCHACNRQMRRSRFGHDAVQRFLAGMWIMMLKASVLFPNTAQHGMGAVSIDTPASSVPISHSLYI